MDDYYVYIASLPPGINEMVEPCANGYTIYISDNLSPAGRARAYQHALRHIKNGDFEKKCSADMIEIWAHK